MKAETRDTVNYAAEVAGDKATSYLLTAITSIANIFGAGSAAEELLRDITNNPGLIPKSTDVESAIMKDLSKAKTLSNAKLTKLQNLINSPNFAKSNIQKSAVDEFNKKIKQQMIKLQASQGLADDLMNSALNTASSIDYAVTGSKRKIASKAQEYAQMAKEAYNKVVNDSEDSDINSVEKQI